jgi:hypothetical protein
MHNGCMSKLLLVHSLLRLWGCDKSLGACARTALHAQSPIAGFVALHFVAHLLRPAPVQALIPANNACVTPHRPA